MAGKHFPRSSSSHGLWEELGSEEILRGNRQTNVRRQHPGSRQA